MFRSIEELESEVRKQLRELNDRYRLEAEPLVKILADIEACKPPKPVFIDMAVLSESDRKRWLDQLKSSGVPIDEAD